MKKGPGRKPRAETVGTRRQSELERAREFAQYVMSVLNTLRQPFLVLDERMRVCMANRAFYRAFQVRPEETEGRCFYLLGNGQWNIPELHELLDNLLAKDSHFDDFEVRHRFESNGERTMLLNARKLCQGGEKILLTLEDVTERKAQEAALKENRERAYQQLAEIEAIYHSAQVGLCVINRDLRYVRVNRRMAEMNGVAPADHIGKTVREVVPAVADVAERLAGEVFRTGQPLLNVELCGETAAGFGAQRCWTEQWLPVKNERGEVAAINVAAEEITERKQAETELRERESRFRDLAEDIPQLVWTCDPEGQCDYVSPQWAEYTGIPAAEHLGRGWARCVHPEDQAHMWEICTAAKQKGENFSLEYRLRNRRGEYRWFKVAALPVRDQAGKVLKWFGTSTDIDDQKNYAAHLEQIVEERTVRLRQALGELQTFSYSIAHDMRAPLRAMQGFTRLLAKSAAGKLEPEGMDYIQRISQSASRLDRLIQDVLSYTRILHGTLPMQRVDTDKLVREMIAGQPDWQPPKADVAVEGTLPAVWANEAFLTQAISNLLVNAVKFVAEGTLPRVRMLGGMFDGEVRLWVEDNGIGIAPEDQERIFKLLDRVHPESTYEGTGLGLAIARRAVERMGGRVGVESFPGQGSRFRIQLKPAEPAQSEGA